MSPAGTSGGGGADGGGGDGQGNGGGGGGNGQGNQSGPATSPNTTGSTSGTLAAAGTPGSPLAFTGVDIQRDAELGAALVAGGWAMHRWASRTPKVVTEVHDAGSKADPA